MSTRIKKGILALGLAGLMIVFSASTWNESSPVSAVEGPLPGTIAAYSDAPTVRSSFFVTLEPTLPEEGERLASISFAYRLTNTSGGPTTVSFVLSGRYADMLTTCEEQSIDRKPGLRFEELSASARLALIAVEQRGQQVGGQGAATQVDKIEAGTKASAGQFYTRVTIPVTPKPGGSSDETETIGAEGSHRCGADLGDLWNRTAGGFRILAPPMAASAPEATSIVTIYPSVKVKTDDKFFILRSTAEFNRSGDSTVARLTDNTYGRSEGFRNAVASSMSSTYTSVLVQDRERNYTLFIGVLLGAAASIVVATLSGAFDLLVARRPATANRAKRK